MHLHQGSQTEISWGPVRVQSGQNGASKEKLLGMSLNCLQSLWQRLSRDSRATFAPREAVWRWTSLSLDLCLDLLDFMVENSFSHRDSCFQKGTCSAWTCQKAVGRTCVILSRTVFHLFLWTWLWAHGRSCRWAPFVANWGHFPHLRGGLQTFGKWHCVPSGLHTTGQIPAVALQWYQHLSHHWMLCPPPQQSSHWKMVEFLRRESWSFECFDIFRSCSDKLAFALQLQLLWDLNKESFCRSIGQWGSSGSGRSMLPSSMKVFTSDLSSKNFFRTFALLN